MKSADALDALWEAGLGEFEAGALDGAAERVEGAVRRRRVQRNRTRAVSAVAALVVVAALAMLASDNSSGKVGVSSPDASSSTTTIAGTKSRRVTTPSISVPGVVEPGDTSSKSPSAPNHAGSEPVTGGRAPATGTGGGGTPPGSSPAPPAPPRDPSNPDPPRGGPPSEPIHDNSVTYVLDDAGLHASTHEREAGPVTVKFLDQRTDQSKTVALRSEPQGVLVAPGTSAAFDLRVLRNFNLYAAHGNRRASNLVPLSILEPELATPTEPANEFTVDVTGGQLELPYREVRVGEPLPQTRSTTEIPHRWTSVGPATILLRVRNLDHASGSLRLEHSVVMHLYPSVSLQVMQVVLDQRSKGYTLRLHLGGSDREMVLWRSGPR